MDTFGIVLGLVSLVVIGTTLYFFYHYTDRFPKGLLLVVGLLVSSFGHSFERDADRLITGISGLISIVGFIAFVFGIFQLFRKNPKA